MRIRGKARARWSLLRSNVSDVIGSSEQPVQCLLRPPFDTVAEPASEALLSLAFEANDEAAIRAVDGR